MGKNIFVSYKYADDDVQHIRYCTPTTVRHYVDILEEKLRELGHRYCGEGSDEDLGDLSDEAIYRRLKNKMFSTSGTIVLISPKMRTPHKRDRSQWIPWEIHYSLRESTRQGKTSHRNSILAVVLPDKNGSYEYMIKEFSCCPGGCQLIYRGKLFHILKKNMFNKKEDDVRKCKEGDSIHYGYTSYIHMVKWCDFIDDINYYVGIADILKDNIDDYDLHISVDA